MATNDGGFIGQDGLNAPDSPTGVSATAGDTEATISFTAPSDVGGSAITGYSVQSDNGDGTFLYSYSLENAAYNSVSFGITQPHTVRLNNDGTKAYFLLATGSASQYSLTTAYDISTATTDSKSFSFTTQDASPRGITFNGDGTKVYMVGYTNATVYQYSLSTAFDISTASYDSVSFSLSSQGTLPDEIIFNNDGTKFYVCMLNNETVFQYSLSSAYDMSTATYDSVSLDVSGQSNDPRGMALNGDGTKFFVLGQANNAVYQYSLGTAYSLSGASYDSVSFDASGQVTLPTGLVFGDNGTKMYIAGYGTNYVYQYTTGLDTYPTASPITVTGLTNGTSYTFNVWAINAFGWSGPSDASGSVSPFGPRAIFGYYLNMQYVTIATLGNAASFGNFSTSRNNRAACSSSSRAVFGGGEFSSTAYNEISFVEFATTGNSSDFGDLTVARWGAAGASNSTRGLFATGDNSSVTVDVIDYITIASAGNAIDFGDASDNFGYTNRAYSGGLASSTRAVFGGGVTSGTNDIDRTYYVTIATTGNGTGFGGLTASRAFLAGASNSTRGLFAGGYDWAIGSLNVIDYITIATTGDATDFGDLTAARHYMGGAASSTRALFVSTAGSNLSAIDYVTIASTGNAADFGDISNSGTGVGGCSSGHGGLS
jgi:hypothetical protein